MGGIYSCNTPLTGNNIGLQKIGTNYSVWAELRAYEMSPMALTASMLSTNVVHSSTLSNALSFSMAYGQTLGLD